MHRPAYKLGQHVYNSQSPSTDGRYGSLVIKSLTLIGFPTGMVKPSNLSDLLTQEKRGEELKSLLTVLRPFFSLIPKAKTAKIVIGVIDAVAKIPRTSQLQITLCREMVEWTRLEKRTFLRQRVEARLAALLMESKEYSEALTLISGLVKEVRRLDDKLLLVGIDLLECKLHFSLRNLPKAKATLTAARTAANAIYVPPAQQGTIDLQSGILHAEEKDYKTACPCTYPSDRLRTRYLFRNQTYDNVCQERVFQWNEKSSTTFH